MEWARANSSIALRALRMLVRTRRCGSGAPTAGVPSCTPSQSKRLLLSIFYHMTTSDRLIIFTRYPVPGAAKTRLIPALGAEGAAELHRTMAEYTLAQSRVLQSSDSVTLEVRFDGGSAIAMEAWLGSGLRYQLQGEGDLGDRLIRAFQSAFDEGATSVIIIGTDCPELNAPLLQEAFKHLRHHNLVLGPAVDGGYYLIGLRSPVPKLFQQIAWSTATVLRQTVEIAERLGLAIAYLPTLSDVDYPEDLPIWEKVQSHLPCPTPVPLLNEHELHSLINKSTISLSIIIPVLNEARNLPEILNTARTTSNTEIIVVDGGSKDDTPAVATSLGAKVIHTSPGRAHQMNQGAKMAAGEILLFLHGDTQLPANFDQMIYQTLSQPGVVAGAFELKIGGKGWGLRVVEWGVSLRSRLLQLPYGDQALFLKTSVFQKIGGFPELPIMEDFVLVQQLHLLGKIAIAPAPVVTSGRRWQRLGICKTTLINQLVILAYF
ncbi:TIGR04283 family arsenosugar biosynthesis glycosyltransferase [Leptothermofonsia sp. ETS-13]|uniref:TIGR04283 family arsenosugar biosynthesis glycosyltransferase n=1 Tax=Leptothermofonsia sp. ETS-13 TaxID=3035696 RepID=UPI003B9EA3D4